MTVAGAPTLIDRATASSGLVDFGVDGWQIGLEHLLDAVGRDLRHNPVAVTSVEDMIVRRLVSRLEIEAWYSRRGDDGLAGVEGPMVIIGLPRTATTALHYLLSMDPQFRFPRQWEMSVPVPPPDLATEAVDPRRLRMAGRGGDVRHISSVDGPTEDGSIHALHFGHQELALPLPTYSAWWRCADLRGMFAYQERVLRLLHSRRPAHRWLLKAPAYLFHLPEMSEHYPAARFVMTHRDPAAALPSACSVVLDARSHVPGLIQDKVALGEEMVAHFSEGIRLAMAARAGMNPELFFDVGQEEVEQDPVGTAARIYRYFGLEISDPVKVVMRDWAAANQRGSRGVHQYSAEEFGLTIEGIRRTFADYSEQFGNHIAPAAS